MKVIRLFPLEDKKSTPQCLLDQKVITHYPPDKHSRHSDWAELVGEVIGGLVTVAFVVAVVVWLGSFL